MNKNMSIFDMISALMVVSLLFVLAYQIIIADYLMAFGTIIVMGIGIDFFDTAKKDRIKRMVKKK